MLSSDTEHSRGKGRPNEALKPQALAAQFLVLDLYIAVLID